MRNSNNAQALTQLPIDYIGFIFFEKSKRNITEKVATENKNIQRTGVFVNEKFEVIKERILDHQLDAIQLHGDETPDFCKSIQALYVDVIKVFSVDENFDFEITKPYENFCNYFLFDTKGKERGGNGVTFDWSILAALKNIEKLKRFIDDLQH